MMRPAPRVVSPSVRDLPRLTPPPLVVETAQPTARPAAPAPRWTLAVPSVTLLALTEGLPSDYYLG
jgi:hypothetical protein